MSACVLRKQFDSFILNNYGICNDKRPTLGFHNDVVLTAPPGVSSFDFRHFLGMMRCAGVGDLALCIAAVEEGESFTEL